MEEARPSCSAERAQPNQRQQPAVLQSGTATTTTAGRNHNHRMYTRAAYGMGDRSVGLRGE